MKPQDIKIDHHYYYDSFSGLIKIQVIDTIENTSTIRLMESGIFKYKVKVTSRKHPLYKYGEIITTFNRYIINRSDVHVRNGQFYIREIA